LLVSALMIFCCATVSADASKVAAPANTSLAITVDSADDGTAIKNGSSLPDAPVAKTTDEAKSGDPADISPAESSSPGVQPFSNSAVRSAGRTLLETPRQRQVWYGLMVVSHGAAAFDAYSTRRAVAGNYGVEGNPMLRPFSHSNAIYAATQVSPVVMDYVGHRMLKSHNLLIRRFWWLPQTAGAGFSLGAGIHNYRLVP
jgi:hypothetical protein